MGNKLVGGHGLHIYPFEPAEMILTTNVIESLNYSLRKIIKNRAAFPNDDAVYRLIFLGLKPISQKRTMPIRNWKASLQQLALFSDDQLILDALMATDS